MLPLPPELRVAGVTYAWNELRRQWRWPVSILASDDSSLLSRKFATNPRPLRNLPTRRNSHSKAEWTIPHVKAEPNVYPESLRDTLEAHRDANLSSLIRKRIVNASDQDAGISRLKLNSPIQNRSKERGQLGEQERLEARCNGSSPALHTKEYPDARLEKGAYVGTSRLPTKEWELPQISFTYHNKRPWLAFFDDIGNNAHYVFDYLTAEILAFEKYMELTASEKRAVTRAFSDTRKVIATVDPAIRLRVKGSQSTGLAMPLSDIDINIEIPNSVPSKGRSGSAPAADTEATKLLARVTRKLKKKGGPKAMFRDPFLVKRAKVPIIDVRHVVTGLEIQIQCTADGYASMEMVKAYVTEFPTLRPLFCVLRQLLKMRGLGEARTHGIGSYTLIMMIVAALKFSSSRFNRKDAGRQLLYFLDFYTKIDFETTGIAVEPSELFLKRPLASVNADVGVLTMRDGVAATRAHSDTADTSLGRKFICTRHHYRPYLMCLQDPANPYNDLGGHATGIKHVQTTLETLGRMMKISMDLFATRRTNAVFSLLEPCLAGNYKKFEMKREALQEAGGKCAAEPVIAEYL